MHHHPFWRIERAAGLFLVLGFVTNLAGVVMFNIRDGVNCKLRDRTPPFYGVKISIT